MDLGYARVSTAKQDLDRQIDALTATGIPRKRIYLDKKPAPPQTDQACARWSSTRETETSSSCTPWTG